MLNLNVENWHYMHAGPLFNASIKAELSDFKVFETLSFEPSGDGEHTFLEVEKTGLNTAFVAEEIAKFAQLPLRAVSYAGRKDKFATTTQWFGIYAGGKKRVAKDEPKWHEMKLDGLRLINVTKNQRKLRTGAIANNRFEIVLRNIKGLAETDNCAQPTLTSETFLNRLNKRLEEISLNGVPNYYGNQRFGELIKPDKSVQLGGNLIMAERLINGEEIRNRNKKSMAVSALRSWLFNQAVSHRLSKIGNSALLNGDALMLAGTNSFFIYAENDDSQQTVVERIAQRDVSISAPLWGGGKIETLNAAYDFENNFAQSHPLVCQTLAELGLEQQRRAMLVFPSDMKSEILEQQQAIKLSFSLPSGCFATSVLREIANTSVG